MGRLTFCSCRMKFWKESHLSLGKGALQDVVNVTLTFSGLTSFARTTFPLLLCSSVGRCQSDLDLVIGAAAINSGMSESVPELVDTVSLDCDIETEEKMRTAQLKVDTLNRIAWAKMSTGLIIIYLIIISRRLMRVDGFLAREIHRGVIGVLNTACWVLEK